MNWIGVDIERRQADLARTLEAKAEEVARYERRVDEVVERLEAIEATISSLAHDEDLRETLEATRNAREREKLDEQRNALVLQDDLAFLLKLVDEAEGNTAKDAHALADLRAIGEDVGEAESIVEERRAWAEATRNKINELMERIGGRVTEPVVRVTAGRRLSNNIEGTNRYVHPGSTVEARFQQMVAIFGATNPSGWIDAGNPLHSSGLDMWMNNCGPCSRSFADTFHGKSAKPAMGDAQVPPGEYEEMWDAVGVTPKCGMINSHAGPEDFQVSAFQALEASLRREGPGAVAIIGVDWDVPGIPRGSAGGHWFNAYVDRDGIVQWADQQNGKLGGWPPHYQNRIWQLEAVVRQSADGEWKELVL